MSYLVAVKPMTFNQAYTGRRFKSPKYKAFIVEVGLKLRPMKIPAPPYEVHYIFAVSNEGFDWDNGIKAFQDILSKRYNFNDNLIYKGTVEKRIVEKGSEYIKFDIQHYEEAKAKGV